MKKIPCVYILANRFNGTLYIGVTSNLLARLYQHQNDLVDGFSKTYQAHHLVWYECHPTMESAIRREKLLKDWNRIWKIRLIEKSNPKWDDLSEEIKE